MKNFCFILSIFAAASTTISLSALATEVVVQNDSLGSGTPLARHPSETRLGVRLTSPSSGNIVGIQVVWGSTQGGAAPSEQLAITISQDGPVIGRPGTTLATIGSPTLLDGGLNEFRFLDPATNLIPLNVPVAAGETFFVDLALAGLVTNPLAPGVLYDNSIQPQRNFITQLGGWVPFQLVVVPAGDLGIRAIIAPVPEPSTVGLAAIGLLGLATIAQRRRAKSRVF